MTSHQVDRFADPRQELLSITLRFLENGRVDPPSNFYFLEQASAVLFLMQVANLEPVSLDMAMKWTGKSAERIRQAIVSYLEYACLSQVDDPYRILAVLPQSSSDAIRQHYRQMMKLFHPDRRLVSDPAKAQGYAALINQAYATLNKNSVASAASTHRFAAQSRFPTHVASDRFNFTMGRKTMGSKTIGRKLFQAIFLLVLLGLLMLYVMINFNREPVLLSKASEIPLVRSSPVDKQLPVIDLIDQSKLNPSTGSLLNKNDDLGKDAESKKIIMPGFNQSLAFQHETSTQHTLEDAALARLRPVDRDTLITPGGATPFVAQDSQLDDTNIKQAEGLAPEIKKQLPRLPKPLTQVQLDRLLIDFLASYNQGNLDALMNLIGNDVKTAEAGALGKYGLKNAYGNLFSDTIKRQMMLENPHWKMQGARAVGNMAFNADVQYKGSALESHYQGVLTLEVTLVNAQPVITGLFVK